MVVLAASSPRYIAGYDSSAESSGNDQEASQSESAHVENRFGPLRIELEMNDENDPARLYVAELADEPPPESDYDEVLASYRSGLYSFYRHLLTQHNQGFRVWIQLNITFVRTGVDGVTDRITVPFRIEGESYLDPSRSAILSVLNSQFEEIAERISNLLKSGSNWSFESVDNALLHITSNLDVEMNAIGAIPRWQRRRINRFGNMAKFHLNSAMKPPLSRHIINICSDRADCFIMAIGLGAMQYQERDYIALSNASGAALQSYKQELAAACARNFNCRSLQSMPVTFAQLSQFENDNHDQLALNIYGFTKKPRGYRFFPYRTSKNNYQGLTTINLLITHREETNTAYTYHVNYITNFHNLIRAESHFHSAKLRNKSTRYCLLCLRGYPTSQDVLDHGVHCASGSPRITYPSPSQRLTFFPGKKLYPTNLICVWDIETRVNPGARNATFGPLSRVEGKVEAISVGLYSRFALHPEKYMAVTPKVLTGSDCLERFLVYLRFECFYLQAAVRQNERRMRPLLAHEQEAGTRATHCCNCKKPLTTKVYNHCHEVSRL